MRGKRLGLTLAEVRELVDMYESPRDTQPQLKKFLAVLAAHRSQLEQQMADLHATLDEVRTQEREARRLLNVSEKASEKGGQKAGEKSGEKASEKSGEKAADKRSVVAR